MDLVKTAFTGVFHEAASETSPGTSRLYAEIRCGGRLYALERTGMSLGRLLFQCCLDAANAEAWRESAQ
jgi:hypothetical protein